MSAADRLRALADQAERQRREEDDLRTRFENDHAAEWIGDNALALARGYADALHALAEIEDAANNRKAHGHIGFLSRNALAAAADRLPDPGDEQAGA